jgi:hypothetical protein
MRSQASNPRQTPHSPHRRRWAGTAAVGTLAFVALVVVLLPASAMAAPMSIYHTIRITAPYSGTTVTPSMSISTSGCGTASLITAPFFHPGSGRGGFSGSAAASGCPTTGGSGSTYESFSASIPIAVIPGHDKIVAKWTLHVSGGTSMGIGKCSIPVQNNTSGYSYCSVYASSILSGYAYIYDSTNGTYVATPATYWAGLSNSSSYYIYCYAGNCTTYVYGSPGTFAFHGPLTFVFNANGLLATHTYVLVTDFYGSQYASENSYFAPLHHAHASAWLNAGTFGNGLTLNSITVT